MAEQNGKQTPPYIPYATFDNFLNGLGESAVPGKIDSSLMRTLSGSTRSGLMVALRYLKLIDENDNTQSTLEKLAKAQGNDRAPILYQVLQCAYGFMDPDLGIDLTRATPAQLAEAIGAEGAGGGTRDKAVGFFLKAAEAAGLPLSPHILKGKHVRATPTRRAKRSIPKTKTNTSSGAVQDANVAIKKLSEVVLSLLDAEELPEDVEAAIWTLLKYLRKEGK